MGQGEKRTTFPKMQAAHPFEGRYRVVRSEDFNGVIVGQIRVRMAKL
jgi:hypothetical protein